MEAISDMHRVPSAGIQDAMVEAVKRKVVAMVHRRLDTAEEREAKKNAMLEVFDNWQLKGIPAFLARRLKAWLRPMLADLIDGMLLKLVSELAKEM